MRTSFRTLVVVSIVLHILLIMKRNQQHEYCVSISQVLSGVPLNLLVLPIMINTLRLAG